MSRRTGWLLLITANVLTYCVLSFYQTSDAAVTPFANSVEQRFEIVTALHEIRDLLKEQNQLLRSGKLHVVVEQNQEP